MSINADKLYRRVIEVVLARIRSGDYRVGMRLPPERELAETHQVSRTTIREAMVALEMLGFVEMRKGAGIFVVSDVGSGSATTDLNVGAFELIEARRLVETEIAGLAALYATEEHLAEMEQTLQEMSNPDEEVAEQADREFHLVIARATGNSALIALVAFMWDMRERAPLAREIHRGARSLRLGMGLRIDEHRVIVEAIRSKDPMATKAGMAAHLERVIEHLLITSEQHEIAVARERSSTLRQRAKMSFA